MISFDPFLKPSYVYASPECHHASGYASLVSDHLLQCKKSDILSSQCLQDEMNAELVITMDVREKARFLQFAFASRYDLSIDMPSLLISFSVTEAV